MTTINHECYVDLEVAELLKEAGFDWIGKYSYIIAPAGDMPTGEEGMLIESNIDVNWLVKAPTLDVAQRWLREVKGYHVCAQPTNSEVNKETHKCDIEYLVMIFVNINSTGGVGFVEMIESFKTHEEAQEAGEKKALEIILEKG